MGSAYSNWSEVLRGISQASILGPLLFNIFINAILPMTILCDRNLLRIKENLIFDMKNISFWFKKNSFKANAGKFQFMILNREIIEDSGW